jgi:hypothetical protein
VILTIGKFESVSVTCAADSKANNKAAAEKIKSVLMDAIRVWKLRKKEEFTPNVCFQ